MNHVVVQRCIFLGALIVLLGGIVLLTPAQETEQTVTQETAEPTLPTRPPDGYQVPERPVVTFPYTHISADRLRLANIRQVPEGERVVTIRRSPYVDSLSPDGQWMLFSEWERLYIVKADGSGEERVLHERWDAHGNRLGIIQPIWSWDSKRVFYRVKRVYYPDEGRRRHEIEELIESVDIATGEVTRHTDISYYGGFHSYASARYPDDPVIHRDLKVSSDPEIWINSIGTRDGSARWVLDPDVSLASLSPNKQMVFAVSREDHTHYLVYAADGSGLLHRFVSDDDPGARSFLWSPDSTKFAYHIVSKHESDTGVPLASEIYLVNIDGTGRTQLTNTSDIAEELYGWTADGKIVFGTMEGDLFIADLVAE